MLSEKKIIYQNTRNIEVLKEELKKMIPVLNQNYKKACEFNSDLTSDIVMYLSFMSDSYSNEYLRNKVYTLVRDLVMSKTKYYNNELISDYYNKIINNLLKAHLDIRVFEGMIFTEELPNADLLKQKNLEQIHGNICTYENINQFILFNEDKKEYFINEEAVRAYEEANTYYTSSAKQVKILKTLEEISRKFQDLQEINPNLDIFLFNRKDSSLVYDVELAKVIQGIQ